LRLASTVRWAQERHERTLTRPERALRDESIVGMFWDGARQQEIALLTGLSRSGVSSVIMREKVMPSD